MTSIRPLGPEGLETASSFSVSPTPALGPLEFIRATSAADPASATGWLVVSAATPLTVLLANLPGTGPLLLVRNLTDRVGYYRVALEK